MARRRWRLTETEQREHSQLVEVLRAGGVDLDRAEGLTDGAGWLRFDHSASSGRVYSVGRDAVFLITVRMLVMAPRTIINEVDVSAPSWDEPIYLLDEPPHFGSSSRPKYRFRDGSSFDPDQVLNHRLDGQQKLHRGEVLEGLILAQSFNPLPSSFPVGSKTAIELYLRNQFGEFVLSKVVLAVCAPRRCPWSTTRSNYGVALSEPANPVSPLQVSMPGSPQTQPSGVTDPSGKVEP